MLTPLTALAQRLQSAQHAGHQCQRAGIRHRHQRLRHATDGDLADGANGSLLSDILGNNDPNTLAAAYATAVASPPAGGRWRR